MIKRLLLSLAIIGVVSGAAFVGTKALVSDTVNLTANTFSTGTVDLQINVNKTGGSFADTQPGFTGTMFPCQTITKFFRLKNISDIGLSITAQAASLSGALSPSDVTVAFTPFNSAFDTPTGATVSATLDTWASTPAIISPPNIAPDVTQRYQMDVSIACSVTTGGVSSIFDFVFTGMSL